jgi:hypothetical protein
MDYNTIVIPYVRDVLKKINDTLLSKATWFAFPTGASDGRTNSQQGESVVADFLFAQPEISKYLVHKAKNSNEDEDNRAFGDINIDISRFGYTSPFPCNIKLVSEANKAGNNACGLTSLVGYTFQKKCPNHDRVMEILIEVDKSDLSTITPLLYGLIMVVKESKKCWTGTFDEVPTKHIGTNPSNPLQVPFLTERTSRTSQQYIRVLIEKVVEYYTKKSKPLALWNTYQTTKTKASASR